FVGPSQSGKSQMLMACAAHAICCDPGPIQLNHITSTAAKDWVLTKLEPTLRNSPELAARLGRRKSDDNMFEKGFAGGTRFTIGPPTIEQLSARTRRLMLLSDYDRWADSIGGEGSGATLADARTRTYGSRGMTVIESSPGRARSREDWQAGAAAPHEAPPVQGGILGLYNEGTRARWYWDCPGCGSAFEPRFSLLVYDREAEPVEAGAQAQMGCPQCGTLIDHARKPALNATGRWLHETRDGRVVPVSDADLRGGDLVSYWLQGVAATFATWAQLVALYEAARRKFDLTGD
ncbi:phage terminase large subunit family protein, partial [Oceanicella sp. SM1341]|uniref:phage terminase large subunit family protein n=1 Tax=Oceanicella sp. SM1341 TaxID=1548889 RepID=UPI0018E55A1F